MFQIEALRRVYLAKNGKGRHFQDTYLRFLFAVSQGDASFSKQNPLVCWHYGLLALKDVISS
ncbi:hypothetical protein [Novipirellula caenicola]|uniref:hypothetical protein n=1 Tax=Novipirellula caenicola TaxID=1536901 RepID=UPI0031EF6F23